jgi:hypothetical protein
MRPNPRMDPARRRGPDKGVQEENRQGTTGRGYSCVVNVVPAFMCKTCAKPLA